MIICLEMFLLKEGSVRARMKELFLLSRYKLRLLKHRCLLQEANQVHGVPLPLPSPNTLKGKLGLP